MFSGGGKMNRAWFRWPCVGKYLFHCWHNDGYVMKTAGACKKPKHLLKMICCRCLKQKTTGEGGF